MRHEIVRHDDAGIDLRERLQRLKRTREAVHRAVEIVRQHLRHQLRVGTLVVNEHYGFGGRAVHGGTPQP